MGTARVRIRGVEELRGRPEVPETDRPREADAPARDRDRPRMAHLEIGAGEAPPPGAAERLAEFKRQYKEQLAPADRDAVRLPDELAGLRDGPVDRPIGPDPKDPGHLVEVPDGDDRVRREGAPDAAGRSDAPDEAKPRIDRPESNDPYKPGWQANAYDANALTGPDGRAKPLFDGRPKREDTRQGDFGDCGIIATIGSVAGTAPDKISNAMKDNRDGTYDVTLHETTPAWPDGLAEPTGRTVTYTVTGDLPVHVSDGRIAGAKADRAAWPALMEKAIAGSDRTWTPEQKAEWEQRWSDQKAALDFDRAKTGKPPHPDGPAPTGYQRLSQGSDAYDRADVLAALTGRQAEVRAIPDNNADMISEIFGKKLAYDKPVLVGSRPVDYSSGERRLSNRVEPTHAYEVTGLTSDGRVELRNPWNKWHPEPLTPDQFRDLFSQKRPDGARAGVYTSLA